MIIIMIIIIVVIVIVNNSTIVNMKIFHIIREGVNGKKTFSFGHCPNYLTPPHGPNSGNLVLFFRKSKFKI